MALVQKAFFDGWCMSVCTTDLGGGGGLLLRASRAVLLAVPLLVYGHTLSLLG
jgi:hypothetical protein